MAALWSVGIAFSTKFDEWSILSASSLENWLLSLSTMQMLMSLKSRLAANGMTSIIITGKKQIIHTMNGSRLIWRNSFSNKNLNVRISF